MARSRSIPVRVIKPTEAGAQFKAQAETPEAETGQLHPEQAARRSDAAKAEPRPAADQETAAPLPATERTEAPKTIIRDVLAPESETQPDAEEWRERALRLQAEMENFRKRQQRLAQEQIEAERHRLLNAFLRVVDDLERVLQAPDADAAALRRGIEVTHRAATQLLKQEGVEPIQAEGQPFDPNWHEAIAAVKPDDGMAQGTVLQVTEPGYRLNDRLLRPARVIVAA